MIKLWAGQPEQVVRISECEKEELTREHGRQMSTGKPRPLPDRNSPSNLANETPKP